MKTLAAAVSAVVIDIAASHSHNGSDSVVDGSAVNVHPIVANSLICEEVTVFGDGKSLMLKEVVKLLTSTIRGVLHEVVKELYQRLKRHAITHELEDTINNEIVDRFTLVCDGAIADANISADIAANSRLNVDVLLERNPIAVLDVLLALREAGVIRGDHAGGLSVEDCGDAVGGNDDGRSVHGLLLSFFCVQEFQKTVFLCFKYFYVFLNHP